MTGIYYLAAPYTDPAASVRHSRVEAANIVSAWLMEKHGFCVYSPLTHSSPIVPFLREETVQNHDFWMKQCLPMVKACQGLIILAVPGWDTSTGVRLEVEAAMATKTQIYRVTFGAWMMEQLNTCPAMQTGHACSNCLETAIQEQGLHLVKLPEGQHPLMTKQ